MSFAEILDTHLGCTDVPRAVPPVMREWSTRPLTTPLFAFDIRLTPAPPARVEPAPLPVRLTTVERQTLDDARTPAALRRAFKALARRYHPDSHPDCGAAEHARLARLFAEATDHYHQRLRTL